MTNLFRNSRIILTKYLYISRSSATTSTSSGGTNVRPSGTSANLSETSRVADGTDMAMKNAEKRGTSANQTGSKSTGQSTSPPNPKTPSTPWGTIALGVVLAGGGYYAYTKFIKTSEHSKSLHLNNEGNKKNPQEQKPPQDQPTGKKH